VSATVADCIETAIISSSDSSSVMGHQASSCVETAKHCAQGRGNSATYGNSNVDDKLLKEEEKTPSNHWCWFLQVYKF